MWFNSFSAAKAPPPSEGLPDRFSGKGKGYIFSPDLEAAIDVAIGLGRPLLVSGEPGSGKTELGYAIARRLGIDKVQFFSTKSTSEARDLFYTYDAIGRFRDAQIAQTAGDRLSDVGDYIEFQALGRAILDSHGKADIAHLLRGRNRYEHPGKPTRSIVIIDEIDKAARDFPNDFLREIEDLSFRISEFSRSAAETPDPRQPETPSGTLIGQTVRPIIIVTSNEERQLPDAFLRRCIFHEITFPDDDVLAKIIASGLERRKPPVDGSPDRFELPAKEVNELIDLLRRFRELPLEKKPGVAELIDAATLVAYPSRKRTEAPPFDERKQKTIAALAKLKLDRDAFSTLISGATPSS